MFEVFSQDSFWAPDSKTYPAVTVGDVETNFIRKVFRELDKLLEPEFIETSPEDADIILMGLSLRRGKRLGVVVAMLPRELPIPA